MKTIYVNFEGSAKTYAYKTNLNLKIGERYHIVNDLGINYKNATIKVVNISNNLDSIAVRKIVRADLVQTKKHISAHSFKIKEVIFNTPATIILWEDGTKTVVRCDERDTFSKREGLLYCVMKKAYGNTSVFNDILNKYCSEDN